MYDKSLDDILQTAFMQRTSSNERLDYIQFRICCLHAIKDIFNLQEKRIKDSDWICASLIEELDVNELYFVLVDDYISGSGHNQTTGELRPDLCVYLGNGEWDESLLCIGSQVVYFKKIGEYPKK